MIFEKASSFLQEIGIQIVVEAGTSGFLNHMRLEGSSIVVDSMSDDLVGDMLHEAGHIAVIPSLFRSEIRGNLSKVRKLMEAWLDGHPDCMTWPESPIGRGIFQSGEAEAIAWSYAAAHRLGINTCIPFKKGFDGAGAEVHAMLAAGAHFGVNGLVAGGMTEHPRFGPMFPFPKMKRWMQL